MKKNDLLKYREYHWNYFSLHANQRLRTFNFYLLISAIIIGAFINVINNKENSILFSVLPYILSFISFIFWKLDVRTKQMIKNAENAIKIIDDKVLVGIEGEHMVKLNLFELDNIIIRNEKTYLFKKTLSYSKCFNSLFLMFGLLGLVAGTVYIGLIVIGNY